MKNHTPRTQDVINHIADNPDNLQPIFDHARRLEIELNAAKEQLRIEAGDDYSSIKELQRELAAAKLDCGHAEKRCDAAIASWDEERGRALREGARVVEWKARAERAEAELKKWSLLNLWGGTPEIIHNFVKGQQARIHAAQDVEAELAGIRALADRRNERDHSQDTTHQLVAALDQALDIAQAELATERARLDWLESVMAPDANYCEVFFAGLRNWTGSAHAFQIESNPRKFPTLNAPTVRAAIDAAMKEEKTK